jgi:hypothetical protein
MKLKKGFGRKRRDIIEVHPRHLHGGTEEKHVGRWAHPAEHLSDTSSDRYRYATLLDADKMPRSSGAVVATAM